MQLNRGNTQTKDATPIIASIGNFDGMHLGHQSIMQRLTALANTHNAQTCVITFEPLTSEAFLTDKTPARIHGLRDRILNMKSCNIDRCMLLRFNEAFKSLSADEFINSVLLKNFNLHTLIVGDDFRFGNQRSGTFSTLQAAGDEHDFNVEDTPTVMHEGERISSTSIRKALQDNQLQHASALLGRAYRISGRVVHGEKVGRQLGFPTANIALKKQQPPLHGVFAVRATCQKTQRTWPAVANLGRRPTVAGLRLLLEVHLLDTTENLYGQHLHIDFMQHVRGEVKFDSLDDLKAQIARDADSCRDFFNP